jgi:hypothetical protein
MPKIKLPKLKQTVPNIPAVQAAMKNVGNTPEMMRDQMQARSGFKGSASNYNFKRPVRKTMSRTY